MAAQGASDLKDELNKDPIKAQKCVQTRLLKYTTKKFAKPPSEIVSDAYVACGVDTDWDDVRKQGAGEFLAAMGCKAGFEKGLEVLAKRGVTKAACLEAKDAAVVAGEALGKRMAVKLAEVAAGGVAKTMAKSLFKTGLKVGFKTLISILNEKLPQNESNHIEALSEEPQNESNQAMALMKVSLSSIQQRMQKTLVVKMVFGVATLALIAVGLWCMRRKQARDPTDAMQFDDMQQPVHVKGGSMGWNQGRRLDNTVQLVGYGLKPEAMQQAPPRTGGAMVWYQGVRGAE